MEFILPGVPFQVVEFFQLAEELSANIRYFSSENPTLLSAEYW